MSEVDKIRDYFSRSAIEFDSLYSEENTSRLTRFINLRFRRDIYERFILSMNHVARYELQSVLDVGCGSGQYAAALARQGLKRIVGVDCSQTMLEIAQKNTSAFQGANYIFEPVCCDFLDYQTDDTFDVVIAAGFFDYVKDPLPVLRKMKALAAHSVIASFPSFSVYRTPIRKIRYYFKRCPVYFYNYEKIVYICKSLSFSKYEIIKIRGSGMDYFVAFFK